MYQQKGFSLTIHTEHCLETKYTGLALVGVGLLNSVLNQSCAVNQEQEAGRELLR